MDDPYDLQRFVDAQDGGGAYDEALAELRLGRKTSHWMWFVFPQIDGLGRSSHARHFAISGLEEAQAYARHRVLGPRLVQAARTLTELATTDAEEVLGAVDALKLRSSMTLFARAVPAEPVFRAVLEQYYDREEDDRTTGLL